MMTIDPRPFDLPGGKVGVLLIHGWTGSPSEMRPLGYFLNAHGYTVKGIRLAGHGKRPEDLEKTDWRDWWQSAVEGYQELACGCDQVVVAGLSMGGCLSLLLAGMIGQRLSKESSERAKSQPKMSRSAADGRQLPFALSVQFGQKLAGVVAMCAPVWPTDKRAHFASILCYVYPYSPNRSESPAHIKRYTHRFDKTPVRSVGSLMKIIRLMKKSLGNVQVPSFILQSRLDKTVQTRSADYIVSRLTCKDCVIRWYENSDHMLVIDHDQEQVFQDVLGFIQQVTQS